MDGFDSLRRYIQHDAAFYTMQKEWVPSKITDIIEKGIDADTAEAFARTLKNLKSKSEGTIEFNWAMRIANIILDNSALFEESAEILFSALERYFPLPECFTSGEDIIGWKKATAIPKGSDILIKLRIPADAKKSCALGKKCRCSYAIVEGMWNINIDEAPYGAGDTWIHICTVGDEFDGEAESWNTENFIYMKGQYVYPDKFDERRFVECSNGIHFFLDKESAMHYGRL